MHVIAAVAVCVLSLVGSATAQESRIAQADQLYLQRSDLSRVREAISLLAAVVDEDAESYEALWRLTKYYHFLGTRAASHDAARDALEQGIERGEQAVALVPDRPEGHFWLAASYGSYGQRRNIFKRWRLVEPMRKALRIVISLDPSHENGSAYAVLGKLDSEVPGLFGGNRKRGIRSLEKALDIGPANSLTKLFLAEAYLKEDRDDEARRLLEEILTMAPDEGCEFEFRENQEEARRLLSEHFQGG